MFRPQSTRRVLIALSTTTLLSLTSAVSAQSPPASRGDWQHGTTLTVFGGGATASSESAAAAGLALGWEVTPRLTVEGRGIWFDTKPGSSAFTALLGARVPLLPAHRFNPFASGSVGMFRASFDSGAENIPEFYRAQMDPGGPRAGTFDNFVAALGGGADFFLNEHFALRPEVSVLLVTSGSEARSTTVYGLTLAYHFEVHPVRGNR